MKNKIKLFLSFLFVSTLFVFIVSSFKIEHKAPAPNSCSATSLTGAKCTAECPADKTPNCTSGIFTASCTCEPSGEKGTLTLDPSNKFDELINASLGFGSIGGNAFASSLSTNKAAASSGNWVNFDNSVAELENIYSNVLTVGERSIIDGILY